MPHTVLRRGIEAHGEDSKTLGQRPKTDEMKGRKGLGTFASDLVTIASVVWDICGTCLGSITLDEYGVVGDRR